MKEKTVKYVEQLMVHRLIYLPDHGGVESGDEVITQPLTFVATANAIHYTGGSPVFVDVDKDSMGMSPDALRAFLEKNVSVVDGVAVNKVSGKKVAACVPMHTFGFPCAIDEIVAICDEYAIPVVEDSAESLEVTIKER